MFNIYVYENLYLVNGGLYFLIKEIFWYCLLKCSQHFLGLEYIFVVN